MKASNLLVLPLAYCACLVLFAGEAQAKEATIEDIGDWTKDQVQAYLNKYQIVYDKSANDQSLLTIAKRYRDAAAENTQSFINDKANVVNKMIDSAKLKLTNSYKLSTENANALTADLQHSLKQLELSGSLTHDKVKQSLDKLQHKAVKQKIISELQFKELAQDIEQNFASPSWFQRLWGTASSDLFPEDSYHTWLKSKVTTRLEDNKELTKDEINAVVNTLKNAITSSASDLSKLGNANWWKKLSNDLTKNAKLKQNQVESVVETLQDEVTAYKIFALDYASEAAGETQNMFARAGSYIYDAVLHPLKSHSEASVSSAVSVASSAATAATDAAGESASSLHAKATQGVNDAKDSFGHFWRQKELDAYRKVGYTEAHVEWIQNYLSQTFSDKKNFTKDAIFNAIRTVRQYLVQAKVQTVSHIDSQLKSLEDLIEHWRQHTIRDEL